MTANNLVGCSTEMGLHGNIVLDNVVSPAPAVQEPTDDEHPDEKPGTEESSVTDSEGRTRDASL
jgi:hypothetical protein